MNLEKLRQLTGPMREVVLGTLSDAISHVFFWAVFFTVAVPVLAWFIKEVPLRSANDARPAGASPDDEAEAALGKAPVA